MFVRTTIELDMKLGTFEDLLFYCRIKSCEVFEELDRSQFVSAEELKQYIRRKSDRELYRRFHDYLCRSEFQNAWPKRRQEMFEYYFEATFANTEPYQEIYNLLGFLDKRTPFI